MTVRLLSPEAAALRRQIVGTDDKTAVALVRQGNDTYGDQQSRAAGAMLRRAGFRLGGQPTLRGPPVGDLPRGLVRRPANLMTMLGHLPVTCLAPQVAVLSGDDLTKSEVTGLS